MKIQLSIAKDYSPKWGRWEGIRELVQNWMDARKPGDFITHDGTYLRVVNQDGAIGPKDLAVLGATDKAGDSSTRGQFGDGLKVGCLALVRAGLDVTIRSADRIYSASIEHSQEYGTEVLMFHSGEINHANGVEFVVGGLPMDEWDRMNERFLLDGHDPLLLDKPGQIFVKDIWVCRREGFSFGYNLPHADVGRDRDLIGNFDLCYAAGKILAEALKTGEASPEQLLELLTDGSAEVAWLKSFIDEEGQNKIRAAFKEEHGDNAVATYTDRDHRRAKSLGHIPVFVNESLVQAVPTLAKENELGDSAIVKTYEPNELNGIEGDAIAFAINIIGENQFDGLEIEVVDFAGDDLKHSRDKGRISVAHWTLTDKWKTMQVLIEALAESSMKRVHEVYTRIIKENIGC